MPQASTIVRYEAGRPLVSQVDELATEEPLEIRVGGRALSVTMRTPGNDDELAAGFLLSEGLIKGPDDVLQIEPCAHDRMGNIVNVFLAPGVQVDFSQLTRHVFASSSCGLCGKATIESVCRNVEVLSSDLKIDAATLLELPLRLRAAQPSFDRTGGLHGAAVFTGRGELIVAREDIGRHNAVDKVLGYGLLHELLPFDHHVLMISGRASFEIMQKSLSGRIPVVAAVSAPSSLARDFAMQSGQTLIGFLRGERMNIYSGQERVQFGAEGAILVPKL